MPVTPRHYAPAAPQSYSWAMGILKILGLAILVLWLVLWLAVKITFGAIHLLALLGLALVVVGFLKASTR